MQEPAPLLVLDLDGTLLDTVDHGSCSAGPPDFTSASSADGVTLMDTYLRPGLAGFLGRVQQYGYQLAVWTAAPRAYADAMIDGIDRVAAPGFRAVLGGRVLTEDHVTCSFERGRVLRTKDLQRFSELTGVPLHRCLVVDDTPHTYALNVRNALPVEAYMAGYTDDDMLDELAGFLCSLNLTPGAVLDLSAWKLAPFCGAGPLTVDAVREQTQRARRASMTSGPNGGPPIPAWVGRGSVNEPDSP